MAIRIDKKIVDYRVGSKDEPQQEPTAVAEPEDNVVQLHEKLERPDMLIGYAKMMRGSNESALGEIPAEQFEDNTSEWSGDHCMDPAAVPGVLFSSRPLPLGASPGLVDLAPTILAFFGQPVPAKMTGSPLWPE